MFDTCDRDVIESHRLQTACNLGFVVPIPERLSSSTVLLKMVLVTHQFFWRTNYIELTQFTDSLSASRIQTSWQFVQQFQAFFDDLLTGSDFCKAVQPHPGLVAAVGESLTIGQIAHVVVR